MINIISHTIRHYNTQSRHTGSQNHRFLSSSVPICCCKWPIWAQIQVTYMHFLCCLQQRRSETWNSMVSFSNVRRKWELLGVQLIYSLVPLLALSICSLLWWKWKLTNTSESEVLQLHSYAKRGLPYKYWWHWRVTLLKCLQVHWF